MEKKRRLQRKKDTEIKKQVIEGSTSEQRIGRSAERMPLDRRKGVYVLLSDILFATKKGKKRAKSQSFACVRPKFFMAKNV